MEAITEMNAVDLSSYPTVFNPDTLQRKGLCPVTTIAHKQKQQLEPTISDIFPESHSLYFEVHGDGPQKVVLVNGLNASSFGWNLLVEHLTGVKEADGSYKYSVLVFDNRGVGNSGTPKGPYNTSGMANDVILLLEYIGWTSARQLHVIGLSMGGMISLEMASRISPRIVSLTLIVTSAGGFTPRNLTPLSGALGLTRLVFAKAPEDKLRILLPMLYPSNWLNSPAVEYDTPEMTHYQYLTPVTIRRIKMTRPQTLVGALSQMAAALTHHVSPTRLAAISKSVPKVLILTGDEDQLVNPKNSFWLRKCMPEAEFEQWDNTGHGITIQRPKRFHQLIDRTLVEGWERLRSTQVTKALAS